MGLYVHSLLELPIEAKRSYYIYLLDYGWDEPLEKVLLDNFQRMAEIASRNDAVVIQGTKDRVHFHDDVFSWHNVNGENAKEQLPAILVTNRHPHDFKESHGSHDSSTNHKKDFKIILFPIKKYCKTTTDVITYVDKIFRDIIEKKDLSDFQVTKEMRKGLGRTLVDGIILEPNIGGIGFNFNTLIDYFRSR